MRAEFPVKTIWQQQATGRSPPKLNPSYQSFAGSASKALVWGLHARVTRKIVEEFVMVAPGKTVKVHYKGTLDDGSIFDSSEGREPLEFKVGAGQVIEGFDAAIQSMEVGATKTVTIPSDKAYGDVQEGMIAKIPKAQFPADLDLEIGLALQLSTPQGPLPVRIVEIEEEGVTIDGNHPLAGQNLTFELTLVAES